MRFFWILNEELFVILHMSSDHCCFCASFSASGAEVVTAYWFGWEVSFSFWIELVTAAPCFEFLRGANVVSLGGSTPWATRFGLTTLFGEVVVSFSLPAVSWVSKCFLSTEPSITEFWAAGSITVSSSSCFYSMQMLTCSSSLETLRAPIFLTADPCWPSSTLKAPNLPCFLRDWYPLESSSPRTPLFWPTDRSLLLSGGC